MEQPNASLVIRIGPLHYAFVAHDAWGQDLLTRLRANLDCLPFDGEPDRVVHLLEFRPATSDFLDISQSRLPSRLAQDLPQQLPPSGWMLTGGDTGFLCWYQDELRHALGTPQCLPNARPAPFHLPWQLILRDMVQRGGGILHGGLAEVHEHIYLFVAPPGGGKTTALSRLPAPWTVLADDAGLVWPGPAGEYRASPLPTWSVLLGRGKAIPAIDHWQVGKTADVAGVILLHKARRERLCPLPPIQAAQDLYRAFSEHPQVVTHRVSYRGQLFHTACSLARAVPCWRLELTRQGPFWQVLGTAVRRS